ncbi:thioesterase family protein [Pseudodonghicola flavimaris]|uniref:Thioesterase family protein n=1 Tax=Pseudodonghicola flavimaris TaxID=3050036 RepID=A0ABT7F3K3_9RHOB|nr:thioesterase family protein [Pseudodonghicola flavimaris]MDK3019183.1 thioesterase family protein [Pseudodonghicola flavimaris]
MTGIERTGHDGPYPAPVEVTGLTVLPQWIDLNGHMNVGYYGIAFDEAADVLFIEHLGIGGAYIEAAGQGPFVLQSHTLFLNELREAEAFRVAFRLVDHDHKRMHFFGEMIREADGVLCATQEVVSMNVDHGTRRSAAYPDWIVARLARMKADHAGLPASPHIGAPIGLRR